MSTSTTMQTQIEITAYTVDPLPPAMSQESEAADVLGLYRELWRLHDDLPQDSEIAFERAYQQFASRLARPMPAEYVESTHWWAARSMFDAGFRRGVVFTRWLDAILADPQRHRTLLEDLLADQWWLLDAASGGTVTEVVTTDTDSVAEGRDAAADR